MKKEAIKAKLKKIHKSLTIWVNGVTVALVPLLADAQNNIGLLKGYISQDLYKYAFIFLVVANVLLRFKTNKGLDQK